MCMLVRFGVECIFCNPAFLAAFSHHGEHKHIFQLHSWENVFSRFKMILKNSVHFWTGVGGHGGFGTQTLWSFVQASSLMSGSSARFGSLQLHATCRGPSGGAARRNRASITTPTRAAASSSTTAAVSEMPITLRPKRSAMPTAPCH